MMNTFQNAEVAAVFEAYPDNIKKKLVFLRQLIFDLAEKTTGVREIEETLKWGQPSYLTINPKSGTTIRIDQVKTFNRYYGNKNNGNEHYGLYVHCQTTLLQTYKDTYPDIFQYDGNRGIIFSVREEPPVVQLSDCICLALTYHLANN